MKQARQQVSETTPYVPKSFGVQPDRVAHIYSGDPKMDAIRGNAISDVKRSSDPTGPRTDLTSVQNIIGPPEYCKHMKEFIARRFFVPTSPQDHDPSELSEVGGQFIETACEPSLNSTPKKPPIHEVMHDIRPTLIKTPEDAKRRNKMTVRFVGNNSTTRNPPKTPSSEASNHHQSGEAINTSLGEAMDALTPSKSCDTNFFASCKSTFISDAHVWNYLDETRVLSLLKRCRRGDRQELRDDLAQKICGMPTSDTDIDFTSYRKVFALLILLEKADQIAQFVDSQIHDNLLPLPFQGTSDAPTAICYPGNYKCHLCFQGWRLIKLKDFVSLQSEFCAPYFKQFNGKGKPYQYQFPTGVALPFLNLNPSEELKKDDPSSRSGGFSVVKKVILPEEHGNLATWVSGPNLESVNNTI